VTEVEGVVTDWDPLHGRPCPDGWSVVIAETRLDPAAFWSALICALPSS